MRGNERGLRGERGGRAQFGFEVEEPTTGFRASAEMDTQSDAVEAVFYALAERLRNR